MRRLCACGWCLRSLIQLSCLDMLQVSSHLLQLNDKTCRQSLFSFITRDVSKLCTADCMQRVRICGALLRSIFSVSFSCLLSLYLSLSPSALLPSLYFLVFLCKSVLSPSSSSGLLAHLVRGETAFLLSFFFKIATLCRGFSQALSLSFPVYSLLCFWTCWFCLAGSSLSSLVCRSLSVYVWITARTYTCTPRCIWRVSSCEARVLEY